MSRGSGRRFESGPSPRSLLRRAHFDSRPALALIRWPLGSTAGARVPTDRFRMARHVCALCKSDGEFEPLQVRQMFSEEGSVFDYEQCLSCRSILLAPDLRALSSIIRPQFRPVRTSKNGFIQSLVRTARDRRAFSSDSSPEAGSDIEPISVAMRQLRNHGVSRNDRILGIDCGTGNFLYRLRMLGFKKLLGTDLYLDQNISLPGLRLVRLPLDKIDGEYDVVLLGESVCHSDSTVSLLAAARERLAFGGKIFVSTPVAGSWGSRNYGPDWAAINPPLSVIVPSVKGLASAAERAFLQIIDAQFDMNETDILASELIRRSLPVLPNLARARSIFGSEKLRTWRKRARQLNFRRDGDRGIFVMAPV